MEKDWQDLRNKELDDFFRNHLEKHDFPFVDDDWEKMRSKLENPQSINPLGSLIGRNKGGIALVGSLILTAVIMLLSDTNSGVQGNRDYLLTQIQLADESNLDFLPVSMFSHSSILDVGKQIQNEKLRSPQDVQPIFYLEDEGNDHQNQIMRAIPKVPVSDLSASDRNLQNANFTSNGFVQDEHLGQTHFLKSVETVANRQIPQKVKCNIPINMDSKFALSLIFSPDVSALHFRDIRGVGSSVGLNLEYFIQRKLSVNLGMIYSFKTYQTHEGYGGTYSPLTISVSGECFIFDIPINFRYYAINGELDRWYISSGLSSYLMLTEKYSIEHGPNSPTDFSQIRVDGENNHLFNILNFSLGYERKLADKWALQVEPYVRIPVSGIGERNVNLKSSGVWIGIKHSW